VRRYLAVIAASALLLAACDGDDAPPTDAPAPTDPGPGLDDEVEGQDLDEPELDDDPDAAARDDDEPAATASGTAAPDGPLGFEAQVLDGEVVDVAATFGGGPVLLWMWAPW
jgi:hypothetical protein